MTGLTITLDAKLLKDLLTTDGKDEAFTKLMETILSQVLQAQVTEQIQAHPYMRNEERLACRNGA